MRETCNVIRDPYSSVKHHGSPITFHVSRFTHHASRSAQTEVYATSELISPPISSISPTRYSHSMRVTTAPRLP